MRSKLPLFFSVIVILGAGGLLFLSLAPPVCAYETTYLYPIGDAMVQSSSPTSNFGSFIRSTLGSFDADDRIGFFQFNMSDFDPDLDTGESYQYVGMAFQLYADYVYSERDRDNFFYYGYTNDSWSEGSITWNSMPSYQNVTTENVEVTLPNARYSWDLTAIIDDIDLEIEADSDFTIVIKYEGAGSENLTQDFDARMREYGGISFDPRLAINYNVIVADTYEYETEPSLAGFPIALADALQIPYLGGQLLASTIILLMFLLPTAYASKDMKSGAEIVIVVVSSLVFFLLIAIDYLPVWGLVLEILVIALLYASQFRNWIGGLRD